MTSKDEVIGAIEAADARVKALTAALREHGTDLLPDSEWNVREALCHVAARANAVPLSLTIMERMLTATGQTQPLDPAAAAARGAAINQAQLTERMDRSMDEVLAEIEAGHQAAIAAVQTMPQAEFDQRFQRVTGDGDTSLGELILRAGAGHEKEHLDQIESALGGAPR